MLPALNTVIADKYRIDRVLGEGGMGTVFAAVNLVTGKQVAIKWLRSEGASEEYVMRFVREAQVASSIEHPNVVNVFDMGRHDGSLFLVMELLYGEPLSATLSRGRVSPTELVRCIMPVLRGVHAAHRLGVVHRDLKPDNIFLCRDAHGAPREPKVLDFGISKIAEGFLDPHKPLTRDGAVFGTPQYMAPEQVRSTRSADVRSDVYAIGVILYRALSGRFPYDAEALPALALAIVEGKAQHLLEVCPLLPPALADIVMRAIAREPHGRFQTIAELGVALEPFGDGIRFENTDTSSWSYGGEPLSSVEHGLKTPETGFNLGSRAHVLRQRTPASQRLLSAERMEPSERISAEPVHTPIVGLTPKRRYGLWAALGTSVLLLLAAVVWLTTPARRRAAVPSDPQAAAVQSPASTLPGNAVPSLPPPAPQAPPPVADAPPQALAPTQADPQGAGIQDAPLEAKAQAKLDPRATPRSRRDVGEVKRGAERRALSSGTSPASPPTHEITNKPANEAQEPREVLQGLEPALESEGNPYLRR